MTAHNIGDAQRPLDRAALRWGGGLRHWRVRFVLPQARDHSAAIHHRELCDVMPSLRGGLRAACRAASRRSPAVAGSLLLALCSGAALRPPLRGRSRARPPRGRPGLRPGTTRATKPATALQRPARSRDHAAAPLMAAAPCCGARGAGHPRIERARLRRGGCEKAGRPGVGVWRGGAVISGLRGDGCHRFCQRGAVLAATGSAALGRRRGEAGANAPLPVRRSCPAFAGERAGGGGPADAGRSGEPCGSRSAQRRGVG